MTPSQVKAQYKDEWLLLEVLKEDAQREPLDVQVLAHSPHRDDVYDALLKVKEGAHVATVFTGNLLKEGYAAAFFVWDPRV